MKINFTKEHYAKLKELVVEALFDGEIFRTKLGQILNVYELIHTVSINQLNEIKNSLADKIQKLEGKDEWVEVDTSEFEKIKSQKELVNLIIGYKRFNFEKNEIDFKRRVLSEKLLRIELKRLKKNLNLLTMKTFNNWGRDNFRCNM